MPLEIAIDLEVEEVVGIEALERLRPEWDALWARCPRATPFQSPEWLVPWWRHVGEGLLWTFAVRAGGRLAGLVPLYVYTHPDTGARELFPLGIATTDYLDALFEDGLDREGMRAVFARLDARRNRWDAAYFPDLRPDSPLLRAPAPPGWTDRAAEGEVCPALDLPPGRDIPDGVLPDRMRDNLRYYRRRAEKAGPAHFESADRGNLDMLFEALLRLHRARWETRGEPGVLAEARVQRAHREALPGLLARGLLRLHGLYVGERLAAVYYGFMDPPRAGRRAYYYLGGLDPEFERLSPGTLLVGHAVQEAVREGAEAFDFLRGPEPYKYLWGARDRPTWRRWLRHGGGR